MPKYAAMFDLMDDDNVLGFAKQGDDGSFYPKADGSTSRPPRGSVNFAAIKVVMARIYCPKGRKREQSTAASPTTAPLQPRKPELPSEEQWHKKNSAVVNYPKKTRGSEDIASGT